MRKVERELWGRMAVVEANLGIDLGKRTRGGCFVNGRRRWRSMRFDGEALCADG